MSVNHVFIRGGRKYVRPIFSEEEYRRLRDSQLNLRNLYLARLGKDWAKRSLLQMNYSGYYPNGVLAGSNNPSMAFGFDIDDNEAFDRVKDVLLSNPGKYGLLMLERSVSQGGHAVFKREKGKTILENQVRISCLLHCEMDCRTHDVNRVYFTTSNEDLLYVSKELFEDVYNEGEVEKEVAILTSREKDGKEDIPAEAHGTNKHLKPWEYGVYM